MKGNFLILCLIFSIGAYGADVDISGPATVCPGMEYTYTATASNVFGSRQGCYGWQYYEDGQWTIISPNPGNCDNGVSSSSVNITWSNSIGPRLIIVTFDGEGDYIYIGEFEELSVTTRVFNPGLPKDNTGGLAFCSSNDSKTISIPGIPDDPEHCNYHHKYDWIVPSGWSVVPTNLIGYEQIPGGIRTFSTNVIITAPSGQLLSGYSGNYKIIVKTEPAWPWPAQSERKIWVGNPSVYSTLESGQHLSYSPTTNNVCNYEQNKIMPQMTGQSSYTWQRIQANPTNTSWGQLGKDLTFYFWAVGQTATFKITTSNSCGLTSFQYKFQSISCSSDPCSTYSVSPNPSSREFNVAVLNIPAPCDPVEPMSAGVIEEGDYKKNPRKESLIQFITLLNMNGEIVIFQTFEKEKKIKNIKVDIQGLPAGVYILKISDGEMVEDHRLYIKN